MIKISLFISIGAPTGDCFHINATGNVFSNTTTFNQLYQNGYNTGVFGLVYIHK